jgi:3-oxoacyl-[acyl-carrier-protein] synthase-3
MTGAEIYINAIRFMLRSIRKVLDTAQVDSEDISHVIPHQANIRILQSVVEHAGLDRDRLVTNLDRYGNTASASILIALSEALDSGAIQKGDLILMVGIGAGMTWGSALLQWRS